MAIKSQNFWAQPAERAAAVTTSDSAALSTQAVKGLYIGVSGDVKIDMPGATGITFKAVPVGFLPIQATKVYATGTTATNILALY